jgi:hypothetical protein
LAARDKRSFVTRPSKGQGLATAALLISFLASGVFRAAYHLVNLFRLNENGFGDSYILYDVWHYLHTGMIYRNLADPPYLAAQYSPMVYRMYALVSRPEAANPFFAPRLLALATFASCVFLVISLVRALVPGRHVRLWAFVVAMSFICMEEWPLQLRGDFAGAFFGILAVRLLLSRFRYNVLLAGLCAGFALQFKITFVAAIGAGFFWLLLQREWKKLFLFAGAAAATSVGLYLLISLREPRMFSQMAALSPGIWDPRGTAKLLWRWHREPAVLIALAPLAMTAVWRSPRWRLLFLFAGLSAGAGVFASMQAGANINYFFEALFALTPLTVLGILELMSWSTNTGVAILVTAALVLLYCIPEASEAISRRSEISPGVVRANNESFARIAALLRGRHFLSTVPRLSLLQAEPPLVEPYLLSYQLMMHKIDAEPLLTRVRSGEFEFVITRSEAEAWRGVPFLSPVLEAAIRSRYKLYCSAGGASWLLPIIDQPPDARLVGALLDAGCHPSTTQQQQWPNPDSRANVPTSERAGAETKEAP